MLLVTGRSLQVCRISLASTSRHYTVSAMLALTSLGIGYPHTPEQWLPRLDTPCTTAAFFFMIFATRLSSEEFAFSFGLSLMSCGYFDQHKAYYHQNTSDLGAMDMQRHVRAIISDEVP